MANQRYEWIAEPRQHDGDVLEVHHYDDAPHAFADVASLLNGYPEAEHVAIARVECVTREYTYLARIYRDGSRVDVEQTPEPRASRPKPARLENGTPIRAGVVFDDGGRAAAGFKGSTGDCVTRAVAIATGIPYAEVYAVMAAGTGEQRASSRTKKRGRTARKGINVKRKWFRDYMASIGWEFVPTMAIGSGCRVHLVAAELPAGRLIVSVSKHYTAVVDGVIRDTFDPNDRPRTVYQLDTPSNVMPAGVKLLANGNGWVHEPGPRCVYGYWRKVAP